MSFNELMQDVYTRVHTYFNVTGDVVVGINGGVSIMGTCEVKKEYQAQLTQVPVRFKTIRGRLTLANCTELRTLAGLPDTIDGSLQIRSCPKLHDLTGLPIRITEVLELVDLGISDLRGIHRVSQLVLLGLPNLQKIEGLEDSLLALYIQKTPQLTHLDIPTKIQMLDIQTLDIPLTNINCPNTAVIQLGQGTSIAVPPPEWFLQFLKSPQMLKYIVADKTPTRWLDACHDYAKDKDILKYFAQLAECGIKPVLSTAAVLPEIMM